MKSLVFVSIIVLMAVSAFPQKSKIALGILNFDNNSVMEKDKLEPLAKGLASMLITELEQIDAFKIVERQRLNDVLAELKLQQSGAVDPSTIQKIGKLIGAKALLMGSFMNFFGNKMRMDIRIVSVETGLTIKAEEETGDLDNMFEMLKKLTKKIPKNFDVILSDKESQLINESKGAEKAEGTIFYSKGIELEDAARASVKAGNKDAALTSYNAAIAMYSEALKKSPGFSDASMRMDEVKKLTVGLLIKENNKVVEVPAKDLTIFEPDLSLSKEITLHENMITIRGKFPLPNPFKEISVNGQLAKILADKEFYYNLKLNEGANEVIVKGVSEGTASSVVTFKVICANTENKPLLTILEPSLKRGVSVVKKSDFVKVRGVAAQESGIKEVLINGKPAELSASGEFAAEINLSKGDNKISLQVTDNKGATVYDSIAVSRSEVVIAPTANSGSNRFALVIGNSKYDTSPLRNPANDANAIAKSLGNYGFNVSAYIDVSTQKDMKKIVREFGKKLQSGGIGMFYYSGHGMQVKGVNYLIPVDAVIEKEEDVEFEAMDLNLILAEMEFAKNPMNIVMLDACRNNPYSKGTRAVGGGGLAQVSAPAGTIIAFSTAPGSVASDGTGSNGLYTQELLKAMDVKGQKIEDVFKVVRSNVRKKSNSEQVPWENTSLEGDFFFNK